LSNEPKEPILLTDDDVTAPAPPGLIRAGGEALRAAFAAASPT
jgi:hypothetical protein